jgi:hypothetical protein
MEDVLLEARAAIEAEVMQPVFDAPDGAKVINLPTATGPTKKIFIAIPCGSGEMSFGIVTCLMNTADECHAMGWSTRLQIRASDSIITRCRNILATHFLTKTDCTDLMFIDDDVTWTQGAFARMFNHPVDVVGGAYPVRGDGVFPPFVLRPFNNVLQHDPVHGLMEVDGLPTGFLRITRKALEAVAEQRKDRWYEDMTAPDMKIIDFFDFEFDVERHMYFSEDYAFCRRVREAGFKTWVDPELTLFHTGKKIFGDGSLGAWLRAQHAKYQAANVGVPESPLDEAKRLLAKG